MDVSGPLEFESGAMLNKYASKDTFQSFPLCQRRGCVRSIIWEKSLIANRKEGCHSVTKYGSQARQGTFQGTDGWGSGLTIV